MVSKRPTPDQINSVGISYGTYNRRQVTADLGGAFDEDGKVLYRLNMTGRKSDGRTDGSKDDRLSVAPTVLWNITNQTRLTVLGTYSKERHAQELVAESVHLSRDCGLAAAPHGGRPGL